jgi:D-amino-acid oxidase
VKGQLAFLLPQPEVDYCTLGPGDIYMFPRRDGILLGGSHEEGVWSTEPDPATTGRILRENQALFDAMPR